MNLFDKISSAFSARRAAAAKGLAKDKAEQKEWREHLEAEQDAIKAIRKAKEKAERAQLEDAHKKLKAYKDNYDKNQLKAINHDIELDIDSYTLAKGQTTTGKQVMRQNNKQDLKTTATKLIKKVRFAVTRRPV